MSRCRLAAGVLALAFVVLGSSAAVSGSKPITIGVVADCVGAFAPWYTASLAGVELPLIERGATPVSSADPARGLTGGSIAGRPLRLVFGCTDSKTLSALTEARRLVEALGAEIVIGPTAADQELAYQDYARRRPSVTFVNGSSGGFLRSPAPNFFSFVGDGRQWVAGLGSYAYRDLGLRRVVVIANPDIFSWLQTAGFTGEFCSLGGTIAKRIWFWPTDDFSSVLKQIPHRGVDGFFVESYTNFEKSLVKNYPGLTGRGARRILSGFYSEPGNPWFVHVRGQAFATPNGTPRQWARFEARIRRALPRLNPARYQDNLVFAIDYYVAIAATMKALTAVDGDLSHGARRFQAALARTEVDSPNGRLRLGGDHQAVVPVYLMRVDKPDGSDRTLIRVSRGVDHTYGGYFTKRDPPPSESTPVCRKGHVPPWARSG